MLKYLTCNIFYSEDIIITFVLWQQNIIINYLISHESFYVKLCKFYDDLILFSNLFKLTV